MCLSVLFAVHTFCAVDAAADVYLTNYRAICFQQPNNLSMVYLHNLCRDNNGHLYCYYQDAQGQVHKVFVYNVRGKQNVYQVTIGGVVYETFLDPAAMRATSPK